jgi:hypothetical protein
VLCVLWKASKAATVGTNGDGRCKKDCNFNSSSSSFVVSFRDGKQQGSIVAGIQDRVQQSTKGRGEYI